MLQTRAIYNLALTFAMLIAPFYRVGATGTESGVQYKSKQVYYTVLNVEDDSSGEGKATNSVGNLDEVIESGTVNEVVSTTEILEAPVPVGDDCANYVPCASSRDTYNELIKLIGIDEVLLPNFLDSIVGITILSEYWIAVDQTPTIIHYRPIGTNLRELGQEAIARNLYNACNHNSECTYDEIYHFMSGFSPWIGGICYGNGTCSADHDVATQRANNLYRHWVDYKNNKFVLADVAQIVDYNYAQSQGWTSGAANDRPWQWFNHNYPPNSLGYSLSDDAIMFVFLADNNPAYQYAWFYTFAQTKKKY